jgi:hypothetical protein
MPQISAVAAAVKNLPACELPTYERAGKIPLRNRAWSGVALVGRPPSFMRKPFARRAFVMRPTLPRGPRGLGR